MAKTKQRNNKFIASVVEMNKAVKSINNFLRRVKASGAKL